MGLTVLPEDYAALSRAADDVLSLDCHYLESRARYYVGVFCQAVQEEGLLASEQCAFEMSLRIASRTDLVKVDKMILQSKLADFCERVGWDDAANLFEAAAGGEA